MGVGGTGSTRSALFIAVQRLAQGSWLHLGRILAIGWGGAGGGAFEPPAEPRDVDEEEPDWCERCCRWVRPYDTCVACGDQDLQ